MTERRRPETTIPTSVITFLKETGAVEKDSPALRAVLQCATCPVAKEPFYAKRAAVCASIPEATATRISIRLLEGGTFENRRREPNLGRSGVTLYDVSPVVKMLFEPQSLPNCQRRI